jgi:hypothetical protein
MTHFCSRKVTHTKNTIWRAPTAVRDCSSIIHAEGVPINKMKEFQLKASQPVDLVQVLERAKS